jgi:hypothetical protein
VNKLNTGLYVVQTPQEYVELHFHNLLRLFSIMPKDRGSFTFSVYVKIFVIKCRIYIRLFCLPNWVLLPLVNIFQCSMNQNEISSCVQRFSKQRTLYWIGYTCESQTWRINREIAVLPRAIPYTQPVRQTLRQSRGRVWLFEYRPLCHPPPPSLYTFTPKSNLAWMVYQLQKMHLTQTLPGWQQITLHVWYESFSQLWLQVLHNAGAGIAQSV